jgi:regulatory protein
MKRPAPSLQARALGWLAQREQSRTELRRKLLRVALQRPGRAVDPAAAASGPAGAADGDAAAYAVNAACHATDADDAAGADTVDAVDAGDIAAQVDALLDRLQSEGLLSEQRFIESRVRVRAASLGTRRIQLELARHGLKLPAQPLQQMRDSELQRAAQLWRRKFGVAPLDARERARQARFLAGRGFSAEVIAKLLGGRRAPPMTDTDDV